MNSLMIVFLSALAISNARPNGITPQNLVTVPPNCPAGQEWVNGQCRDVWKTGFIPSNVVSVPPNCSPGQVYVNGQCRDVWKTGFNPSNLVTVAPNCAAGQEYVNGQCRDIWLLFSKEQQAQILSSVITNEQNAVPSNVVTVPPNCPNGQEYVNGQCRDVWIKRASTVLRKLIIDEVKNDNQPTVGEKNIDNITDTEPKNIISVPNQCPNGYKPDALGVCREIFNP